MIIFVIGCGYQHGAISTGDGGTMTDARFDGGVGDSVVGDVNTVVTGMVSVPAGPFMRGCNAALDSLCETDESPYTSITLSAFQIDRTEVTFANWSACVAASACAAAPDPGSTDRPVSVPHAQAIAYCAWAGKRLPTEAEWEKAARGTDGRTYPWGSTNLDCTHANIGGCGGTVHAVGSLPLGVSPYGALDMLGNVWEWVADSYDSTYYTVAPSTDPPGPAPNQQAIRRGGGTASDAIGARVANRGWNVPGAGDHGVRCVK